MKKLLAILTLLAACYLPAQEVPRDPLTINRTTKQINESFKVPSGKFINFETGSTLNINGTVAGSIELSTDAEETALSVTTTYGDVSVFPHVQFTVHADWSGTILELDKAGTSIFRVTQSVVTLGAGITLAVDKTITAGGTTGAQTINKIAGSVNLAASATSLVVTNSKVTTSSVIMLTVGTNDANNFHVRAVAASGSFTIHVVGTAPAAETRVNFWVIN